MTYIIECLIKITLYAFDCILFIIGQLFIRRRHFIVIGGELNMIIQLLFFVSVMIILS